MNYRHHYDQKLGEIRGSVIKLGGLASDMVRMAVEATLNNDVELAKKVIAMDDEVDRLDNDTLELAAATVMVETPVASDLKMLASALGILGEIEKVADDAVKMASRSIKLSGLFPAEMKRPLREMAEEARRVFAGSLRLFTDYNHNLAVEIRKADSEIDRLYGVARHRIYELIQQNPKATEHLVRSIEVFHAIEHVADHAEDIAKRIMLHYEKHPETKV